MAFSKLSVELYNPNPRHTKVLLNGEPVPGLRGVNVDWQIDKLTIATLTIALEELHVDTETMIQLRALMEAQQQPETRPTVVAPLPGDDDYLVLASGRFPVKDE